MIFIETPIFSRISSGLLSDEEYRELQSYLLDTPDAGAVIRDSGGIRKLRWAVRGHGKRGGLRVIYYWRVSESQILMLYLYPKNVQDDLTNEQLAALKQVIRKIEDE